MRQLCIHAHFYQPPREDPLTGFLPKEPGAYPYPNWNAKIFAECYRPNAVLGNFGRISFNIGPTLFDWLSSYAPDTSRQIVTQDWANLQLYGVGNAMAQPYNHTILPLASYRDKVTQVAWGIADFKHRFGRQPQGMWLPEAAVDYDTLGVLVDQGIEYTVLAPWQAATAQLDVTEPYRIDLPDGRSITVLFYHAPLSGGISFSPGMTVNADRFVIDHLPGAFNPEKTRRGEAQLLLLASDGELYGHHQPLREYFLSHLTNSASEGAGFKMTYPGLWLQEHPPRQVVAIREYTSWSCHHGVKRWGTECDCTPGQGVWKETMRRAFDWFGEQLDRDYEAHCQGLIVDPWALRDRYIEVLLGQRTVGDLLAEMAGRWLPAEQATGLYLLLEAQRERQRMFTSCGWFFEDLDRIEPRNSLIYAAMAVDLHFQATGTDLGPALAERLTPAASTRTGLQAAGVFRQALARIRAARFESDDRQDGGQGIS